MEFDAKPPLTVNPRSIMVNGKSDSSTGLDTYTLKLSAHLPALLAKERKEVLVIGLGTGVTAGEIALYPDVEHVDVAEISPAVIEALPYFKDSTYSVHENPKLRILTGDAFRILGRSEKKWDIIISEPSNPWVTGVDLLFTEEFYRMVKSHLTDGGIFLQWAHQYDSSQEMLGTVFNTLQREFPECRLFWSNSADLIILATPKALTAGDVRRAGEVLLRSDRARDSLRKLDLDSVDSLLIREIWTPSYFKTMFPYFDLQTMDHPRLHYVAGKAFFNGFNMDPETLWSPASIPFCERIPDGHEISRLENACIFQGGTPDTPAFFTGSRRQLDAAHEPCGGVEGIFGQSQHVPAHLSAGAAVGFGCPAVRSQSESGKLDWGLIGLQGAPFRQKAQVLLNHVLKTRNWIVPYRLSGLEALLQQGLAESKDPYERTWCALQLSLLLSQENADKLLVKNILNKVLQINGGKMAVADEDRQLLERVNKWLNY